MYLLWSEEYGKWYKGKDLGFTLHFNEAGRYTRAQAEAIVKVANTGMPVIVKEPKPRKTCEFAGDEPEHCGSKAKVAINRPGSLMVMLFCYSHLTKVLKSREGQFKVTVLEDEK